VLSYCREELPGDNSFHAVLGAVESVLDKLRAQAGLTEDGNTLIDRALTGDPQPDRPAARTHWQMTKEDAEDLLSLVSLIHRRSMTPAHMPPQV
tara:strand:- start:574 stop:855 length:282 start_codon:yes stop_codon:yes gene_type:complete